MKSKLVMELYNEETEHTHQTSNIEVIGDKVYQNIESYRNIANAEQLSAIIENLVLHKGFIIDKNRDKEMKLSNPLEPEIVYYIWLDESVGIKKQVRRLVGNIH